ncbi:28S ribosomal protein S29, mitochondrial-like [Gigantopelta aegis]|uniref:28S ribosomal protein S29, mitochondrial-like n=1 Tax=Gigantopelta aegis TaxID=1735272 RepID=UPI001B88E0B0|nr:28S ribosomal protein S29, mitochondrial-like [Gigantopelta aegis]XP_041373283.1 28S ribosomal protein S29, mitochondrial-like [Gigantopelta aegis]XP_041373289.1 28S ribosomal protein S29, mitochondrial-like [Gigantopelta aegis]
MNISSARCLCGRLPRMVGRVHHSRKTIHAELVAPFASLAEQFKLASEMKQKSVGSHNLQPFFRTEKDDPTKHSLHEEGLFYTLPENVIKKLFSKGLPVEFKKLGKTLQESSVMVRAPALEVIDYIKKINLDYPVPRFMLYGRRGAGKTMTLAHILHYCSSDDWLLIHVPWPAHWNVHFKELSPSSHRSGRIDLPVEAAEWLLHFRTQNQSLIKDMMITSKYIWSKRESSEEGTPLVDVVDFGLNRVKFAADCVGVVLKEVKKQADLKRVKVLVAVDGVNSFWTKTCIKTLDKVEVMTDQLSLVHNFRKMLKNDWTNGVVVCTVDPMANYRTDRENDTPHYLLGKEGFEWMDPFVPIHVPYYTEKEAYSCLEYYLHMKWIQTPEARSEQGKKELLFLSNNNPYKLFRVCASR